MFLGYTRMSPEGVSGGANSKLGWVGGGEGLQPVLLFLVQLDVQAGCLGRGGGGGRTK